MALVAELMETTGKPIINVPDTPIRGSVFDFGRRYQPDRARRRRRRRRGRSIAWNGMVPTGASETATPCPRWRRYGRVRRRSSRTTQWRSSPATRRSPAAPGRPGVKLAAAYPGTPSTEILETLAEYEDVYCEWSPNEKVAMEVGIGASMAGGRALVCMKHVGLNVAADPFFSAVLHRAWKPAWWWSRPTTRACTAPRTSRTTATTPSSPGCPLLEPSDSGEAKDFMVAAYELSERFDTPVLFRTTTRTSHSKSLVKLGERTTTEPVVKLQAQLDQVHHDAGERHRPASARRAAGARPGRVRRDLPVQPHRDGRPHEWASSPPAPPTATPARPCPSASYLKLGLTYPAAQEAHRRLPRQGGQALRGRRARSVPRRGHPAHGHQDRRRQGAEHACWARSTPASVARSRWPRPACPGSTPTCSSNCGPAADGLPSRPPTLCPGCSHRGVFTVLKKLRVFVSGDIGCYTLGALRALQRGALPAPAWAPASAWPTA